MTSDEPRADHGSIPDEVFVQGDIPYRAHRWAVRAVEDAVRRQPWPLVRAKVRLTRPPHLVAVCRADIHADLGGHLFHASAEAHGARSALDVAAQRLHRQALAARAGQLAARRMTRQRRPYQRH